MRKLIFADCWFPRSGPLPTLCHIWTRGTNGTYGQIRHEEKQIGAHVYAWIRKNGPVPKRHFICHDCDEPLCVNEKHLYLGTPLSNMQDKMKRGRYIGYDKSGSNNPKAGIASLSHDRILDLHTVGARNVDIAHWLGVTRQRIYQILKEYSLCPTR